jgi:acetoacetyl-CoA synthetase
MILSKNEIPNRPPMIDMTLGIKDGIIMKDEDDSSIHAAARKKAVDIHVSTTMTEGKVNGEEKADGDGCLWRPSEASLRSCSLEKFRHYVNRRFGMELENYAELYAWSIDRIGEFWKAIWDYCGIVSSTTNASYQQVVDLKVPMDSIPEWFPGSRLNFAENLLYGVKDLDSTKLALLEFIEGQKTYRSLSFDQLRDEVHRLAIALRTFGVKQGDRVAAFMPNSIGCVVAMLATASLGAVWSATSPDFGIHGVLERFQQIQPKILFSVNAVVYNGKIHNTMEKLSSIVPRLSPYLEQIILVPFIDSHPCHVEHLPNRSVPRIYHNGLSNPIGRMR